MSDDFCVEHGYEYMRCEKVWGAIPYCEKCEVRMATSPMTASCETPMSDRVAEFWRLLATEHVRIVIDIRREHDGYPEGGVKYHWDSVSFSDDVAKALLAQRSLMEARGD